MTSLRMGGRRIPLHRAAGQVPNLTRNVNIQRAHGCVVDLLSPSDLKARFPSMYVDDLGVGASESAGA